jgi:predicted negative regulator of RcsB-dependent stress response
LGSALLKLDRVEEARRAYEESLDIVQKMVAAEPDKVTLQRDYAIGLDRVGDIVLAAGDPDGALVKFQQGLAGQRQVSGAS